MYILIALTFLLSRILFLNSSPVFFDSPEYLARLADMSFLNAITSGHLPLHAGYIFIFWPIYQVSQTLGANPALFVILGQIILAILTIYLFYLFLNIISDKTSAFYATLIASIMPLFWITNLTIMMETAYVSFFTASVYLLAKYSTDKVPKKYYLVFSGLCLGISFITHLGVILWIPFLIYLSFFLNKTRLIISTVTIVSAIVIASLINGYLIAIPNNLNLSQGVLTLFTAKLGEHAQLSINFHTLLVYLRNFLIPLFRNFTILVVVFAFVSMIILFFKKRPLFFLTLLWITPAFIANQWWDSVLFGRHSIIAGFGLAFLASCLIKGNKTLFIIIISYLLTVSLPAVYLLKKEIPYLQVAKTVKELPAHGLLVESHFARPQVDNKYKGETIFVDEPGFDKEKIKNVIKDMLKNKKPVFVSSQALSEPYGLYSGPYLHALSLSYRNEFVLKPIIEQFTLEKHKVINIDDNLLIYQVLAEGPSQYPNIRNMKEHRRRIDYSDPLLFLYNKLNIFGIP